VRSHQGTAGKDQPLGTLVSERRRETSIGSRDEAFFAAVVASHGPMVLAVCRRIVGAQADADDAFQATFLLFARNVRNIRHDEATAAWLHRVAVRVSLKLKGKQQTRTRHERGAAAMREEEQQVRQAWEDLRPALDEELSRLPPKYRLPLVLCYLEGKNRDEAAKVMGIEPGSLKGLLERGREALRSKLVRRGVVVPAAVLVTLLTTHSASAAVPTSLATTTATAGAALWAGAQLPAGIVSTKAVLVAASIRRSIKSAAFTTVIVAAGTSIAVLWIAHAIRGQTPAVAASVPPMSAQGFAPGSAIVLRPEAAGLLSKPLADVTTTGIWVKLEPGAQLYGPVNAKNAGLIWGPLPARMEGRMFTRFAMSNAVSGGRTRFTVNSDGPVIMACNNDFGGGGNAGGNWKPECVTPEQLQQQGWQPFAESKDRIFYVRQCRGGQTFTYRTQKYHPPVLVR
jgi:RNA polymerase sigma factor (sigma-70 family)